MSVYSISDFQASKLVKFLQPRFPGLFEQYDEKENLVELALEALIVCEEIMSKANMSVPIRFHSSNQGSSIVAPTATGGVGEEPPPDVPRS